VFSVYFQIIALWDVTPGNVTDITIYMASRS